MTRPLLLLSLGPRMALLLLLGLSCALPAVLGGQIQQPGLVLPKQAAANRNASQHLFLTSYDAYKQYAWGHDDLSPISKSYSDGRNGWGASIFDAMDTLYIMGLEDLFEEAVNFTSTVNLSESITPDTVSLFETSIRYVAGLLSAYELSGKKYPQLVAQAKVLADKMAYSFEGVTIPYGYIDFSSNSPVQDISNVAEAGTLTLEWATLSKYTGNDTYRQLAENSAIHIANLGSPLPGLAAQGIDPASGNFVGSYVSWGGGSDSYFEYLLKYARLSNTNDTIFIDTWKTAVDSSIKNLLRTSTVGNHLYIADFDGQEIVHVGSHLACFYGGNWLLGGRLLNNQTIVNYGLQLTEACWNTYASTATGIGPEVFYYISSDGNYTGDAPPTAEQLAFYNNHGFYISASDYIQRPEVLESNFYAWRITGNTKYLNRAASALESFNKYLPTSVAYAGTNDVNNVTATLIDDMESFWFAEVLKYLYLTFDDPNHISLDDYIFNTECHPFKAPPSLSNYGSGGFVRPKPFTCQSGALPAVSPNPYLPKPIKGGNTD